ncbi:MAG TPA: argininosuccinate synthase domain-containing protein, partial [Povalibacter sp.]|nr:argininosuccinate synthase domain-containing protein [Povalibacter sp.]
MTDTLPAGSEPILLAFSGGLDTSFLVPWLKDNYGRPVITVTVDTGGIDADAAQVLDQRARALGAQDHILVEAKQGYFEQVLKYLIMGNIKRGQMYPLCVGAERVMQAQTIAEYARKLGTKVVAHGCTAAGNDQVRFEVALRTLAPELTILAPVRDKAFKRPDQLKYLQDRNLTVPPYGAAYSVNRGLWGVTIGGKETLTSEGSIPDHAWVLSKNAFANPAAAESHSIGFEKGVPSHLDGVKLDAVALIEKLEVIGAKFGIGRGIHLGDTIIGTKGR